MKTVKHVFFLIIRKPGTHEFHSPVFLVSLFKKRKFLSYLVITALIVFSGGALAGNEYMKLVEEIGVFFDQALGSYRKGDFQEARLKAQSAYFEVFENLEGPIRINISARKNFELEEEFVAIRKMFKNGEPVEIIEDRIEALMAELRVVARELEGGHELVAEVEKKESPASSLPLKGTEAIWLKAYESIQSGLYEALRVYKEGEAESARKLVRKAQFDGYKNTLLETAVRRHVSQGKTAENNDGFLEIMMMMEKGEDSASVQRSIQALVAAIGSDLPGLPLVDGAVPEKLAKKTERGLSDRDWSAVAARLFAEIEGAIGTYSQGRREEAARRVQDVYFDVFEESGMEAAIGAREAAFKGKLESHFSLLVGQMKKGAPVEEIRKSFSAMREDFDKAAAMLGEGADSPRSLFFYSLMIILREGFEAILIITAIVAYLVKTGNRDKLRVIYNGCISALVLSVITAILVKWIFRASAASQEILEGATMILATVVLFSVSYWLISKAEAQKWTAYIKDTVSRSISSGSLKALWFAAFLAVYREGAETVLFYQALGSSAEAIGQTAIAGGFAAGCVLLVGLYVVMRTSALKLPIRMFFMVTGALLYYMAFVFAGKGVMELIEGKIFEPSLVSWAPTIPFMGVFPYWQTLLPQVALVVAALAGIALIGAKKASLKGALHRV